MYLILQCYTFIYQWKAILRFDQQFKMPEGPELHLASRFVNKCCKGTVFSGNIVKSEVHKSEEIKFKSDAYTISATSRGKELQLFLSSVQDDKKSAKKAAAIDPQSHAAILFRFGMSGKFEFTAEADLHKHAHLKFFTKSEPRMVLSYVDVRRFGRFEETTQWGKDRGPDPMFEYKEFRYSISFYYHCGRIFFQFQDELYDVIFMFNHIKYDHKRIQGGRLKMVVADPGVEGGWEFTTPPFSSPNKSSKLFISAILNLTVTIIDLILLVYIGLRMQPFMSTIFLCGRERDTTTAMLGHVFLYCSVSVPCMTPGSHLYLHKILIVG